MLGAARATFIGASAPAAAAGYTGAAETVHSLSNLTYNARSYQIPKISYAGDDSSGQPIFFVGTRSSGGDFICSLIRRNNDGSISESSVTTLKSNQERFEAQGVAGFDSSGNPVGVTVGTYRFGGTIYCDIYANQIDKNNLSLGTTYSSTDFTDVQSNAGFAYATYLGDGKFGTAYRNSGLRTALSTVGTSSISVGNELHQSTNVGDGVYQGVYGLTYQNDSDYLWAIANGNGNQHGVGYFNGASVGGQDSDDILAVGLGRTEPFELAYNKILTVAGKATSAQMVVSDITWPGTGNPTLTNGSATAFSDSSGWDGSFCGAGDGAGTVYVMYQHFTSGWTIVPITASGTTPSEGTAVSVGVTTTNWNQGNESNAATFADSAQGDLFVALIDDSSSNNPQIYIKDMA